jgi:hypothetical protein
VPGGPGRVPPGRRQGAASAPVKRSLAVSNAALTISRDRPGLRRPDRSWDKERRSRGQGCLAVVCAVERAAAPTAARPPRARPV